MTRNKAPVERRPVRRRGCEESERIWPVMWSPAIPDPVLEEERGERAGPPSAPQEGDRLDPDPVEPGEVAGREEREEVN